MDYYEKKYNEALNRAKKIYKTAQDYLCEGSQIGVECLKNTLTDVFPELYESKDERIRKALINGFKDYKGWDEEWFDGISVREAIAWLEKQGEKLPAGFYYVNSDGEKFYSDTFKYGDVVLHVEKQGKQETLCDKCRKEQPSHSCQDITALGRCAVEHEQKPTDMDEPKFKVGDWVVTDLFNTVQIKVVENGYYTIDNGIKFDIPFVDRYWHLWTIKDAKDGDVLVDSCQGFNNPFIFILKKFETVDFGLKKPSDFSSYCYLTMSDKQKFKEGAYHHMHDSIKPATKEQRDQLEKAMADAGWTFDFEKKELKELNPDDLIEESHQQQADDLIDIVEEKSDWNKKD